MNLIKELWQLTEHSDLKEAMLNDYPTWKRETKLKGATTWENSKDGHDELAKTPEGKVVGMWDHERNVGVASYNMNIKEDYEDDYHHIVAKFEKLLHNNKGKMSSSELKSFKKKFNEADLAYHDVLSQADDDGNDSALDSALEALHDIVKDFKAKLVEDEYTDAAGGPGSLDNQHQGAMPAGATSTQQGPQGAESTAPAPNSEKQPAPPKVIGKSQNYRVEVGDNEHVNVMDAHGRVHMSLPYVEWKELTR